MQEVSLDSELAEVIKRLDDHPQVTVNENGTKTVTLSEAVRYKNEEVTALTFRPPRGADWLETDSEKGDLSKAVKFASSLSGVPMRVFREMTGDDMMLCSQVAGTMGKKSAT